MRRSSLVLLGLAAAVVAELAILSAVGQAIGALPLLAVLIGEGVLGAWIARREGAKAWASLRDAQRDPVNRGPALSEAGLVLVGAVLLMLPGFLSDVAGLLFLIPATRGVAKRGTVGIFRALTRRYRDQADLLAAKADPTTVVEGGVEQPRTKNTPDDPTVVRGEVEP